MKKRTLLTASLALMLCPPLAYAQTDARHPLTLEQLFTLADRNSKSLRPAVTGVAEAGQAVEAAQRARLPDINASLSGSFLGNGCLIDRDLGSGMKAPMPHWGNNFALEVTQVIYAGGALDGAVALSRLQAESARQTLAADRNKVRFLALGYYLDLFKQQNLLQVYDRHIELTRRTLRDMRARSAQGIMLKNDVTRYELLLAQLELTRTQLRNTLGILNHDLVTTLGLPDGTVVAPDTTLLQRLLPTDDRTCWLERAQTQSPTLRQLDLATAMSRTQEKLVRSSLRPQVALVAAEHFDGPITIEVPPIDKNFNYWYVGLGVKYNLSALFKTPKSLRRQQLATRRNQEIAEDAREQTSLVIHAGYTRYREAYEQLRTREKSVELARQNYDVIAHRYANELALVTDLLDAANARLSAEVELANARIDIVYQYYKLHYLAGTLQDN